MHFGPIDHFLTGVAIPVFSLRTEESCGVGEFYDLLKLGQWCKSVGIEVIQLLPVNDTGWNASPYSALSSLALHPLYLRLQAIPEAAPWIPQIQAFARKYHTAPFLHYQETLRFKLDTLREIFTTYQEHIIREETLQAWQQANPWIIPYAVYRTLKDAHDQRSWVDWVTMTDPTPEEVEHYFHSHYDICAFYVWMQYHLEQQLLHVSRELAQEGIRLKGDIPIMMSEDSADVWYYRAYFDRSMRAGAPPDKFSREGQNWNFPVYRWRELARDNYTWWQRRLLHLDRYAHAYRIDHVLGFFRLWQIPATEVTAILGFFYPAVSITEEDLAQRGYRPEEIHAMLEPHVTRRRIQQAAGPRFEEVCSRYFQPAEQQGLFHLKEAYQSEKAIYALQEEPEVIHLLLRVHRDRTLLRMPDGGYQQAWFYRESTAYRKLSDEKKSVLEQLIEEKEQASERLWEQRGEHLLAMMKATTPMLVCAEDLGAVPRCVPDVLQRLRILSLKIERWMREGPEPDAPFIPPEQFPRLSVCTPSVHDLPPIRLWWQTEEDERRAYCRWVFQKKRCSRTLTPELATEILARNLRANSILTVFQIQDLFAIEPSLQLPNPEDERINIPGLNANRNWRYRIPVTLEYLLEFTHFNERIRQLITPRRTKPASLDETSDVP